MSDVEETKRKLEEGALRLLGMWTLLRDEPSSSPSDAPSEGDDIAKDLDGGLENVLLSRIIKGEQIEAVFPVYGAMKAGI